jgi:hypothetical protein
MKTLILTVAAVCSIAGLAHAQTIRPAVANKQATIPFVDYGGVQDWRATPQGDLLLRGNGANYYRAQFIGPCPNLKFGMRIGIPGGAMDSLDKFSTIYVGRDACPLKSLTRIDKSVWDATK